jgi:hypothetical protein
MFEHPDVATAWVSIEIDDAPRRVLTVETELPLVKTESDYDEGRVNALISAAQAFKADSGNGIDKVRLIYVEYDEDEDEDEE